MELRVEIQGLREIARAMRELPKRVDRKILDDGLLAGARMVATRRGARSGAATRIRAGPAARSSARSGGADPAEQYARRSSSASASSRCGRRSRSSAARRRAGARQALAPHRSARCLLLVFRRIRHGQGRRGRSCGRRSRRAKEQAVAAAIKFYESASSSRSRSSAGRSTKPEGGKGTKMLQAIEEALKVREERSNSSASNISSARSTRREQLGFEKEELDELRKATGSRAMPELLGWSIFVASRPRRRDGRAGLHGERNPDARARLAVEARRDPSAANRVNGLDGEDNAKK
jgi:hypothetical protein